MTLLFGQKAQAAPVECPYIPSIWKQSMQKTKKSVKSPNGNIHKTRNLFKLMQFNEIEINSVVF
ncbi:hypothetical protein J27TS8_40390 [Robertmurraya siralis]|uniref:Uncharacterized protein n=1 Tax=Robertmurraya siralis TaxID=77777 RepID=A0A919WL09_9BACI|nr:hypothetical protein J27TS8_40390 [Robertmurraya siralis]